MLQGYVTYAHTSLVTYMLQGFAGLLNVATDAISNIFSYLFGLLAYDGHAAKISDGAVFAGHDFEDQVLQVIIREILMLLVIDFRFAERLLE